MYREHLWRLTATCVIVVCLASAAMFFRHHDGPEYSDRGTSTGAAVFFTESINTEDLRDKYHAYDGSASRDARSSTTVRILLVPGHEPNEGGTAFKNVLERDLNADLAEQLATFFKDDPHYAVYVTRSKHAWSTEFATYFGKEWQHIEAYRDTHMDNMQRLVRIGRVYENENGVAHVSAASDAAVRLYGINKWASEHDIDITLHIHFNDYPRKRRDVGKYSGFSIYIPERQYSNGSTSRAIAETVHSRLAAFYPVSDLLVERGGIIEDQDLIATGRYNTLDSASMLIEYGYIYETHITHEELREHAMRDLAFQTFAGIRDFFEGARSWNDRHGTAYLPYTWKTSNEEIRTPSMDILSLQAALTLEDVYPPDERSRNDCPISGNFGPCTKRSLELFQTKHGIKPHTGSLGPQTRKLLNDLYGTR